jgi:hypothetical protein
VVGDAGRPGREHDGDVVPQPVVHGRRARHPALVDLNLQGVRVGVEPQDVLAAFLAGPP